MKRNPIAVISTDRHLKEENALDLLDLSEQEIALAQKLKVKTVIWLGDIFDSRLSQRQELLNCLTLMIQMYHEAGLQIICIPGNHDKTDYEDDDSFLTAYKYHPGFDLIETPQARVIGGVDFDFVPFYSVDMWLDKFAELDPPPGLKSVLCSHTAVQGSINNDGKVVENRIKTKLFNKYGKVLLGHYHNAQQPASNVFHLPSIRQNNFGEDEEKANALIQEYHLENVIKKYPMQTQKELALFYSAIDIFCFPTYRKSDSLGLVGLEAMACGCIVIASNMAGPTSYIKNQENGFFFKPRDGKDLNQKIEDILSMNEHQIKEIKDHAYQTAKAYDVNDISQNLVDIFNGI